MGKKLTALLILDGFGYTPHTEGNAIVAAGTPRIDRLQAKYPHTLIGASGMHVGLPRGQMGNSEVGHTNIGAGRIVYQELTRITKMIEDGEFFTNPRITSLMDQAKNTGKKLHVMGLVSDGGVHSANEHLYAILKMARDRGLSQVYVHAFLDGRDVPPTSGKGYVQQLQDKIDELGFGKIATVCGRFWAMDRDNIWDRVKAAYEAMTLGVGIQAKDAVEAVQASYDAGVTDEFVKPTVVLEYGAPVAKVEEGDCLFFFNFRPDRARQITRAFIDPDFKGFDHNYFPVHFLTMTQYDATFAAPRAYDPQSLDMTMGKYMASLGKTQLRIAETQKYAHVTFFFNGGVEAPEAGEDRVLIPSPKVETFDMKPDMSAYEVTEEAVRRIHSGVYDLMVLNFANPDMVGHTGIMEAAIQAVRVVDECTGKVVEAILEEGGRCIVTADHGNAEQMIDYETGEPYTAHTVSNPVPCILVDDRYLGAKLREDGSLADLAPTLLQMMDLPQPKEMTGKTLIIEQ